MRVVLTGATGLLGGALLKRLLERGDQVLALGRDPVQLARRLPAGVQSGLFDLNNPQPPAELRIGDVVIHCAALLGNAEADRDAYLRSNTESVVVLARAARDAGAALFQFISSVSANGPCGSLDHPLREGSLFHPASVYGESKALAEQALADIAGLHVQVLRPPVIYGPDANAHSSAAKVFRMLRGPVFFRCGSGDNKFNVMALDNLVHAMLFLIDRAHESGPPSQERADGLPPNPDTWMLRDEPCPSMRQVQEWICEGYGRRPLILPLPWWLLSSLGKLGDLLRDRGMHFPFTREIARGFGTSSYYSDMSRLVNAGWQAPVSSREALLMTATELQLRSAK